MTIYQEQSDYKPTYLYIKQHSETNKLYFGKTTNIDPIKYLGSGKLWSRFIKKYGKKYVVTLWYELFTSKESLIEFALQFSKEMDIVKSEQWLNLIPENGINGGSLPGKDHPCFGKPGPWLGKQNSNETKKRKSIARMGDKNPRFGKPGTKGMLGKHHSAETRIILSEIRTEWLSYNEHPKGMLGKHHSEETKEKIKVQVECPHCHKIGAIGAMKGWHFDNCPENPNCNSSNREIIECPHCHKMGQRRGMIVHHFDNCKMKGIA